MLFKIIKFYIMEFLKKKNEFISNNENIEITKPIYLNRYYQDIALT